MDYADVPTRERHTGALDKAVLMSEVAETMLSDRQFNEFVLRTIAGAGNAADAQIMIWAEYCENLPYRRENGEIYRSWREVVGLETGKPAGGDCDDLTILLIAGVRSLGIPALVEILKDEEGWGFHVRARVGLPPHKPTVWAVVDPVWRSEREWALADQDLASSVLVQRSQQIQGAQAGRSSYIVPLTLRSSQKWSILLTLALGVGLGLLWKRHK